jgi:hypothetical protein
LHFPVPSMNRLNQTEPATFSILPCWAFFRDSVFYLFYMAKCLVTWKILKKVDQQFVYMILRIITLKAIYDIRISERSFPSTPI